MLDDLRKMVLSYLNILSNDYGPAVLWTLASLALAGFLSSLVYMVTT